MARRLNTKLALIATAVLFVFFILAIVLVLPKFASVGKLIEDGDVAWEKGDFEDAKKQYLRARSRAKDNEARMGALEKLVNAYLEIEDWPPLRGIWQEMTGIDPNYYAIRYAQLKFFYVIVEGQPAGSGSGLWDEIESQTTEFIDIVEGEGILNFDTAEWERPEYKKVGLYHDPVAGSDGVQRIGHYLYYLRGRARLDMASSGRTTEQDQALDDALDDFKKAQQLEPTNPQVALQIAQTVLAKGNILVSRGVLDARETANQEALEILSEAAQQIPDSADAQINYLQVQQSLEIAQSGDVKTLAQFEPDYQSLAERFANSARVHIFLSRYYRIMGIDYLDKAIEAARMAVELEPDNVDYRLGLAYIYNLQMELSQDRAIFERITDLLDEATTFPSLEPTEGPRQYQHIRNRLGVYSTIASAYLEHLLFAKNQMTSAQEQEALEKAENAVHEIEQIRGSGEDPTVMKWQGMLHLVKGEKEQGIGKLYTVFERLKADNPAKMDTQLAYVLAKTFENTPETGAVLDFFTIALRFRQEDTQYRSSSIAMRKPSALLDYVALLIKLRGYRPATNYISYYENLFGANRRSSMLKIRAMILAGDFPDAESAMGELSINESDRLSLENQLIIQKLKDISSKASSYNLAQASGTELPESLENIDIEQLQKQAEELNKTLARGIERLVEIEPNYVTGDTVINICGYYGNNEQSEKAKNLAESYLKVFPDSTQVRTYLAILDLPQDATPEQKDQVARQALEEITDPSTKAISLAVWHRQHNEPNEALSHFKNVIDIYEKAGDISEDDQLSYQAHLAAMFVYEYALANEDWEEAQKVVDMAQRWNFDQCHGDYFKARLYAARQEYDQALERIDLCLQQRPVFSQAFALRGQIKSSTGQPDQAIEDIKKAVDLNPNDAGINRVLALSLFQRSQVSGNRSTLERDIETEQALQRALGLNPNDKVLLNIYAEFMNRKKPQQALALRQNLMAAEPSVQNALLLARMAYGQAKDQIDPVKKQALMDMAADAYEKALQIDPADRSTIAMAADFYKNIGQTEKVEALMGQAQDDNLRWQFFLRNGQYGQAKEILDRLYLVDPEDRLVVEGLLRTATDTFDQQGVKKYSQSLRDIEDNLQSSLLQIQAYLKVGLATEAEEKLASFREKYPKEPISKLFEAQVSLKKGKTPVALDLANQSLALDDTNPSAWHLRGQINLQMGNYNQAIEDLTKSKSIIDKPEVRVSLARAFLAAGRNYDAITELTGTAEDPAAPETARLLLESIYLNTGNTQALSGLYSKMMEIFPGNSGWIIKFAAFASRLEDFSRAEQLFKKAWDMTNQLGQPNTEALYGYLIALINADKVQEALSYGREYVDTPFAPAALIARAEAQLKLDDKAGALESLKLAADKSKENPTLVSNIILAIYKNFGGEEARQQCRGMLEENPRSIAPNYVLYQLALGEKDFNKAIEYLDKCIELSEKGSKGAVQFTMDKSGVLNSAYEAYSDNKYLDRAVKVLESLLEEVPDNSGILNNLAYMLAQNDQDLEKALEYIKQSYAKNPDNAAIMDTYAYVLAKNGRNEEAAEYVQAAIQQYEDRQAYAQVEMYERQAMIMKELGRNSEAIAAYRKILDMGKDGLPQQRIDEINSAIDALSN